MKKVSIVAFLSLFFLAGCGLIPLSAEEQAYVDNCRIVYNNYQDYTETQTEFKNAEYNDPEYSWYSWSGGYAIGNAGKESRRSAEVSIKSKFPWVQSLVEKNFKDMNRKEFLSQDPFDWTDGDLEYAAIETFFNEMAKGSTFVLTKKILKLENPSWRNRSEPGINDVFAEFSPSDRFKDCDAALGLDEELSMAKTWNDFGFIGMFAVRLDTVVEVSTAIWGCNKFGVGFVEYGDGWAKCADSDFTYTYTDPSTLPPTPEELEILAEREQEAERESQNPSTPSYSNVSPLQLCSSAGVVVQTEKYGELTCGFFWVNKVRTLVWMRS